MPGNVSDIESVPDLLEENIKPSQGCYSLLFLFICCFVFIYSWTLFVCLFYTGSGLLESFNAFMSVWGYQLSYKDWHILMYVCFNEKLTKIVLLSVHVCHVYILFIYIFIWYWNIVDSVIHICVSILLLGEGNGIPFQYSSLENTMDRGDWWATVHGVRYNLVNKPPHSSESLPI